MRRIRCGRAASIGLLAAVMFASMLAVSGAQTPAPYVKVFVDGQLISFDVPPMIQSGRVLVPLRGVFERLGAVVAWDPATQTVLAARADTEVALQIGNPQARINGQVAMMDVPAMVVSGRTLVPLRFVSQVLGSQVSWDAATATVQIVSQGAAAPPALPPSQSYPGAPGAPAPAPTNTTVSGTAVRVNANPAQIMVQSGNAVYTYSVAPTTAVIRTNTANGSGGSVAFSSVQPGDYVDVTVGQSGIAQTIRASYKEVSGRVLAVSSNGVVVLENGDSYHLNASAQATRAGAAVAASSLHAGDVVTLRVNPQTNEIWQATIQ